MKALVTLMQYFVLPRPAYHKDFNQVNLSKEIKSIRQPRQSFLCALIARNQAGEDINDTISLK